MHSSIWKNVTKQFIGLGLQMNSKPSISDSHCHLDFPDFNEDLSEVINAALENGVNRMVTICTRLRNEPSIRKMSEDYEAVYYAAGNHPMSVSSEPMAHLNELIKISKHPKFIAIGETGLDYYYTSDTATIQKKSLEVHINAAQETNLPLIIHARNADTDIAEILESEFKNSPFSCVMHCFSSSKKLAVKSIDLGFYLSMSGIAAFPKSKELREIFSMVPVDRILVETDSPYLAPPPFRGKRNEPAYVVNTARIGAEIFELSYEDFALQTEKNFNSLFKKVLDSGVS
jgi:TatD DNase family protein